MKVAENSLIDLDILPGASQQELKSQAQAQIGQSGAAVQSQISSKASEIYSQLPEEQQRWLQAGVDKLGPDQRASLQSTILERLPERQREQAQSYLASAGRIGMSALNTAGTGLKGVGDTVGNTVGALAGGLADTAGGVAQGAKETATGGRAPEQEQEGRGMQVEDLAEAGKSAAKGAKVEAEESAKGPTD